MNRFNANVYNVIIVVLFKNKTLYIINLFTATILDMVHRT